MLRDGAKFKKGCRIANSKRGLDVTGCHIFRREKTGQTADRTELFMNIRTSRRCEDHQNAENENSRQYKIAPKHLRLNCRSFSQEYSQSTTNCASYSQLTYTVSRQKFIVFFSATTVSFSWLYNPCSRMADPASRKSATLNRLRSQLRRKRESLAEQFDFKMYFAVVFKDKVSKLLSGRYSNK